jgi:CsoR family transcriptional regulator, copper-sensing transcriptional repressor
MDQGTKAEIINRLKSTAGHINGIAAMVDQDRYCIDVIKQLQATQAALAKISQLILDNHLHTCLITAVRGNNADERERVLSEISDVFSITSKP